MNVEKKVADGVKPPNAEKKVIEKKPADGKTTSNVEKKKC